MAGKAGGPNLTRRLIDINGDAGNLVTISATGPTRAWIVRESIVKAADGSAVVPQGFDVYIPNDGSAAGFQTKFSRPAASTANQPGLFPSFENWNRCSEYGCYGETFANAGSDLGQGLGTSQATELCKIRSLTATPTTVEIVEYF